MLLAHQKPGEGGRERGRRQLRDSRSARPCLQVFDCVLLLSKVCGGNRCMAVF